MQKPRHLFDWLMIYYTLVQLAHFTTLVVAGIAFASTRNLGFPASPPPAGWSAQALRFLLGTGIVDGLNALTTPILLYAYLYRKPFCNWLASVNLTVMLYSSILFLAGTWPSGAWQSHPFEYGLLPLVFAPVILLIVMAFFRLLGRNSLLKSPSSDKPQSDPGEQTHR